MADELIVSTGGGNRVAVGELFAEAATLGALHRSCGEWAERAERVLGDLRHSGVATAPGGASAGDAALSLAHARSLFDDAADEARRLRTALVESAERAGQAERSITALWELGVRHGAALLGFTLPLWGWQAALTGAALWGTAALGWWQPDRAARAVVSDPAFIRLVRSAGGALDEAALGSLGVPPALAVLFGRSSGAPENASLLLGALGTLGMFGGRAFVDGPVTVRRDGSTRARVLPPSGIADLAARVPARGAGAPQIRVERYGTGASPRWIVYVTGTITSSPVAGPEPWDLTSDLHGIADDTSLDVLRRGERSGGADRAVRQALTEAGARPGDPILAVGHSLGGIVAAQLASDPDLHVVGAVNLGGPVGSAGTGGVPVLSIEHAEDVIPALGGPAEASPGLVTVRRDVLDGSETDALPAHKLTRYRETAALVDDSPAPELAAFVDLVREVTEGGDGERTDWRAERVSRGGGAR